MCSCPDDLRNRIRSLNPINPTCPLWLRIPERFLQICLDLLLIKLQARGKRNARGTWQISYYRFTPSGWRCSLSGRTTWLEPEIQQRGD